MTERILDEPRLRGGGKELRDGWIYISARYSYEVVPSDVHFYDHSHSLDTLFSSIRA